MKISKYTKFYQHNSNYYIYNSLSNFLCKITIELYNILLKENFYSQINDKKILDIFIANKVITKNENDDLLLYVESIENQRRINSLLNLTIAPTMDCNFSCPYCFENKEKGIMNNNVIDNILNFIDNSIKTGIKHINLTWFGGEPLLAVSVIETICKRLKKIQNGISIYQKIITNGYLLTEDNLNILNKCGIEFIQLSVDGIYEFHNKKRKTRTDKDTFSTIIKNVDNFVNKGANMHLCFRIGIDKENIGNIEDIYHFYLTKYGSVKNITCVPAFIVDTTKGKNKNTVNCNKQKFEFKTLLAQKKLDSNLIYPTNLISECAVRNFNTWAIDAVGNVYKCWEVIGNTDYKVGELNENGITITNHTMLNRYLFGADHLKNSKCINCFNIVNCGGSCPHRRIENEFNNSDFDLCSEFDCNFDNYILERIKLYEHEKEN